MPSVKPCAALLAAILSCLVAAGCRPPAPTTIATPMQNEQDERAAFRRAIMEKTVSSEEQQELTRVESLIAEKQDLNAVVGESGQTLLTRAAKNGHARVVLLLVENKADASARDESGFTPLDLAAAGGHLDSAEVLLDAGADLQLRHPKYRVTALHQAALGGNAALAGKLLDRQADVNAQDMNGSSPLHYACSHDRVEVAEVLLRRGAQIDAEDDKGNTPLHIAALGYDKVFDQPKTSVKDGVTETSYTFAHFECEAVVKVLLDKGADPTRKNKAGLTPLGVAEKGADSLSGPNARTVKVLKEHGAK